MPQSEWRRIIVWAFCAGAFMALAGSTLAWPILLVVIISLVVALSIGIFRYTFIPIGHADIFAALTDLEWKTEQEILETVIQQRGITKNQSDRITVVSFIWDTLTKMEHRGYLVSRPRYDPSGLRSSDPEIEYRLTARGIHQRTCETNRRNRPILRHRTA